MLLLLPLPSLFFFFLSKRMIFVQLMVLTTTTTTTTMIPPVLAEPPAVAKLQQPVAVEDSLLSLEVVKVVSMLPIMVSKPTKRVDCGCLVAQQQNNECNSATANNNKVLKMMDDKNRKIEDVIYFMNVIVGQTRVLNAHLSSFCPLSYNR
jgi:hypothetical protein